MKTWLWDPEPTWKKLGMVAHSHNPAAHWPADRPHCQVPCWWETLSQKQGWLTSGLHMYTRVQEQVPPRTHICSKKEKEEGQTWGRTLSKDLPAVQEVAAAVHNPGDLRVKAKFKAAQDTVQLRIFTSACLLLPDLFCDSVVFLLGEARLWITLLLAPGLSVPQRLVDAEVSDRRLKRGT